MVKIQSDFSGGQTDHIEKPFAENQVAKAINMVISRDRGLQLRPGLGAWTEHDIGEEIYGIWFLEGFVFAYCEDGYFWYTDVADKNPWTRLGGPIDDHQVDVYGNQIHCVEYKSHLIITSDAATAPTINGVDQVDNPPTYSRTACRKIFIDAKTSEPKLVTLQLPKPRFGAVTNSTGSNSYVYKIGVSYDYHALINGEVVQFTDLSSYDILELKNRDDPGSTTVTISYFTFDNNNEITQLPGNLEYSEFFGDTELWDIAGLNLYLCRNTNGGSVFYQLEPYEFDNKDGSNGGAGNYGAYSDSVSDANLVERPLCYDEGGGLMYDVMPNGPRFITIVDGKAWYANHQALSSRYYQAFDGNPAHTDLLVFGESDEPITGISNFSYKPIVFTENLCQRIEGSKDETNAGRIVPRLISDTMGCLQHRSIVKTEYGVFYWSKSGICHTDGIRARIISDHLRDSYQGWANNELSDRFIFGVYNSTEQKIYWKFFNSDGRSSILVLDLRYGISSQSSFTIWVLDNIAPQAPIGPLAIDPESNKTLLAIGSNILEFDETRTTDVIPSNDPVSEWLQAPIKYEFRTCAWDMGNPIVRKSSEHLLINFKDDANLGGVSVMPLQFKDLSKTPSELDAMMFSQDMSHWGELDEQSWGNPDQAWNSTGVISFRRELDADIGKYLYVQLGFRPLKVVRYSDADYGTAVYSESISERRLVLQNVTDFPTIYNDSSWFLVGQFDDYAECHEVTSVVTDTDTTIHLPVLGDVTEGILVVTDQQWKLVQIVSDQKIHLLGLGLPFEMTDEYNHDNYQGNDNVY